MRIIFMGTPDFAIPSLDILVKNGYDVVGVITAPDRPAGRGKKLTASPIKEYALEQGLKVLQPEKLRDPAFLAELGSLQPDLAVVVAFRMLPEAVWSMPTRGTFNLHASLLPNYRGAAPINWAIINGETETGATTFFIDKEIDTGDLLLQTKLGIPESWSAGDLHDALMVHGAELVLQTVQAIEAGTVVPVPQDESAARRPAPKIFKDDCRIDWQQDSQQVYNFIRGLSPYPAAWTQMGDLSLKIFETRRAERTEPPVPGKVITTGDQLFVSCADGWLEVTSLQLQGKRRMDTKLFLNGNQSLVSDVG